MRTSFPLTAACAVLLVILATASAAAPAKMMRVPRYYSRLMKAPADVAVPITVALKHGAPAAVLEATCQAASSPMSPKYGQYMSIGALADLIAPDQHAIDTVMTWLQSTMHAEHVSLSVSRDFIRAVVPVSELERELSVEMHVYSTKSRVAVRSEQHYVLPAAIRPLVDVVLGVCDFVPEKRAHSSGTDFIAEAEEAAAAVAASSSVGNSTDEVPMPSAVLVEVTADEIFAVISVICHEGGQTGWPLCGKSGNPIERIDVIVQKDGVTNTTYSMTAHDLPLAGKTNTTMVLNLPVVEAYHYYEIFVQAVAKNGNKSAMNFQAYKNPPPGFKGIRATPVMTPETTGNLYSLPSIKARTSTTAANNQSVAEFGNEFYTPSDLELYRQTYALPLDTSVKVVGPNNPAAPGIESSMDIQLIMGVAPGVATTFWSVDFNKTLNGGWVLEWALQMAEAEDAPLVTSISYGLPEDIMKYEFPDPMEYMARMNAELLKLCARGRSVLICSQDAGSTDDGHGSNTCAIQPVFPATSPFATAVGSTIQCPECPHRSNTPVGEAAISLQTGAIFTTGGGFSDAPMNRIPWYQKYAVDNYLNKYKDLLPTAPFNHTGRGYPDLSSIGTNYEMALNDHLIPIGDGTSASTPVWAGVISLLNDARLAAGKPALGFLNPLLYHIAANHPEALYDVTVGQNNCGAMLCCPDDVAFKTAPGWDPVTGLGSPGNFTLLREIVLSM